MIDNVSTGEARAHIGGRATVTIAPYTYIYRVYITMPIMQSERIHTREIDMIASLLIPVSGTVDLESPNELLGS
jgi:hypothetical protein